MLALRRALQAAAGVLLPGQCVLCGGHAGQAMACAACHGEHLRCLRPRCRVCANPLPPGWGDGGAAAAVAGQQAALGQAGGATPLGVAAWQPGQLCGRCASDRPAFDATVAAVDYALPLDQLVMQLKFGGRLALAALFGRVLADAVLATPGLLRPALLCPVPLGPRRLAGRGFNQALEIARPLARTLGIALHPRLAVRPHDTAAQSLVQPEQRAANVARAFAIPDRALVEGRHIGLVDDVMTSGATMEALAATLKRHGAARVTCLVFARTPPHHI